jgi:sugar phosphate isomerase/epimerase
LHCEVVVAHFGLSDDENSPETQSQLISSLIDLSDFMAGKRVRLALENIGGDFANTTVMCDILHRYAFRDIGICMDVAHANINEEAISALERCADVLWHVHFSDNDGSEDMHLLPMDGSIAWDRVMATLRRLEYKGAAVFEYRPTPSTGMILEEISRRWRALLAMGEGADAK